MLLRSESSREQQNLPIYVLFSTAVKTQYTQKPLTAKGYVPGKAAYPSLLSLTSPPTVLPPDRVSCGVMNSISQLEYLVVKATYILGHEFLGLIFREATFKVTLSFLHLQKDSI